MKYFLLLVTFFTTSLGIAQFTDNFDDGNFSTSPVWSGDDSVFTIVDVSGDFQLRSNKTLASSSFYLSSPSTQTTNCQWEWFTQLQFNTSSANYVDVYLTADQSDLLSPTLNGYFVRIGGTDDEISLFKRVSGTATKIIDGLNGVTNTSNNTLKIKVTRTAGGEWKLDRDITGSGSTYFTEGILTDVSVAGNGFAGVAITQSTASFFQKHFFDDFYLGPIILDLTPPVLLSATAISPTQIDVLFNEALNEVIAETTANYDIQPFQSAATATLDAVNPSLVHITTPFPLQNGNTYTLFAFNIEDLYGNSTASQTTEFSYLVADTPEQGDLIITEFMADPSPRIGLPEGEFVEIYNKSGKYFNLEGWKLGDASSEGTVQAGWLAPGEYKVLCPSAYIDSFPNSVGVASFPSLNNSSDDILIKENGVILDKVSFTDEWYRDPIKKQGGYTLEIINPNDACSGSDNWIASNSPTGGTPGLINSVYDITPDTEAPELAELIALAPNYLEIYFNEGMDSTSLANATFIIAPALNLSGQYVFGAYPNMLTLQFTENIAPSQVYQIQFQGVSDCWGNSANLGGTFILPELPAAGDIVINEILFDPKTGGSDWIEIYNRSSNVLNLKEWQTANIAGDTIANRKTIPGNFLLQPGAYAVLGKDSLFVKQNYPFAVSGTFVQTDLPSYNNDSGTVIVLFNNVVLDKVSYADDWHFRLLDVTDGVSLERIDVDGPSSDGNNWHSAAEAIGFATPGAKNSQYYPVLENGDFNFTSNVFSPDNDGYEDILQINYEMTEPGMLGTLTIYDDRGRKVTELFRNELLGITGTFKWDGVSDKNVKASIGTYVAVFEAYGLDGGLIFTKRKAFTVAGKL